LNVEHVASKNDFHKNKQPQALPMAVTVGGKKTATGECTVADVYYIACKLTMSRRTPRIKINTTTFGDECFTTEPDHVDYHQLCASFLGNFQRGEV
jgi:hypothetical protein